MIHSIVIGEIHIIDAVACVATALLPSAVLGLKAVGATLLPTAPLFALLSNLLLLRALLLDRWIGRSLRSLLVISDRLLLLNTLLSVPVSLLLGALLVVLVFLLLLDLLLVLVLLLLLFGALLVVLVFLLLLDLLLVLVLLLLLLGVLLSVVILLLLLGVPLGGRFLWLLLAPLLRGLGLFFRLLLFIFIAFLLLLCVSESGGSEK
jgi:hypothetical protein